MRLAFLNSLPLKINDVLMLGPYQPLGSAPALLTIE